MIRIFSIIWTLWALCIGGLAAPISLPVPIYLEDFNAVAEGGLPAGWLRTNYSNLPEANFNLVDLDSASYAGWLVVDRSRFTSNFLAHTSHTPTDYSRVLPSNSANVVNRRGAVAKRRHGEWPLESTVNEATSPYTASGGTAKFYRPKIP